MGEIARSDAYFLNSGRMEVLKNIDGKKVKIGELPPGSMFGEICLIDKQTRTTTIVALENCVVNKINPDNIESIIKKDPKIAMIKQLSFETKSFIWV